MLKQTIKNIFNVFGLEIRKKIHVPLNNPISYNSKESTDKFYANEKLVAKYENEERISFYKEIVSTVFSQTDFQKINSIADVSAGSGKVLKEFQNKFAQKKYFGFEFSDTALDLCRKNCPEISFKKIDLYKGINQKFDLILCIDTLEHLENPEIVLQNILSMLSENGNVCLIVPNGRYDNFEGHIHYWSPESFKLFLEKNNCAIKFTKVWNKYNEQIAIAEKKN
jgi:2-polyprenyl-3-methyl-5-hydroxy-6-metoxy-1,4-benzoquinol methylase